MAAKYRADHVGSLLRPEELLKARAGERIERSRLRALEAEHKQRVPPPQKGLGLTILTAAEPGRLNFMSDFNESVDGLKESDNLLRSWQAGAGGSTQPTRVPGIVVGKINRTKRLSRHEVAFMKQHSPGDIK